MIPDKSPPTWDQWRRRHGRRPPSFRALAVAAVLGAAWSGACQEGSEIEHPTRQNLPSRRAYLVRADSAPTGMTPSALSEWRLVRAALLDARPVASLGRLGADAGNADDPQVFGRIADVEIDDDGRVYVLDRQFREVRIFDFSGQFVDAFGQPGAGPNEFRDPTGLELLDNGRVAVADRGAELKIFAPSDGRYEHETTVTLGFVPEGLCSNKRRVFLAAGHDASGTIMHEAFVSSDRPVRSFGRGYQSDNWLVRNQLSDGRIACLGDPLRIVFAFEMLPVARAYLADEPDPSWEVGVEGYAQMEITEQLSSSGPAVHFSSIGTRDGLAAVRAVGARHVLLQYYRGNPEEARDGPLEIETRSYLVDAETGRGALLDALPLIAAVHGDRQVAQWELPYPRLELRAATSSSTSN